MDSERLWFKSCVGLEADNMGRNGAFCDYPILQGEVFVVLVRRRANRAVYRGQSLQLCAD